MGLCVEGWALLQLAAIPGAIPRKCRLGVVTQWAEGRTWIFMPPGYGGISTRPDGSAV